MQSNQYEYTEDLKYVENQDHYDEKGEMLNCSSLVKSCSIALRCIHSLLQCSCITHVSITTAAQRNLLQLKLKLKIN